MMKEGHFQAHKFAFVGPSSVGKSTMTEVYKRGFIDDPQVAVLEEGAHIFFQENPDITRDALRLTETQRRIQRFVLEREKDAHNSGVNLIITDRSVIDPIVYTLLRNDAEGADLLLSSVAHWLMTYSELFLLDPTDVPYEARPFRETPEERMALYDLFKRFCTEKGLPHRIISGSLEERVQQVNVTVFQYTGNDSVFERTQQGIDSVRNKE